MADDAIPHADVLNSTAQSQLKSIIDRVNRLEVEKEEIMAQIKEVYAEAKGNGFDVKVLKKAVRLLKQDRAKRQEEDAILDLYLSVIEGGIPAFEPQSEDGQGIETVTLSMADGRSVSGTPDQLATAERMVRGVPEDRALYDQAVAIVHRDRKASTSYIQRKLQLGYNRAAALMERMERDGVVGPPDHAGKRDILALPSSEAA